ncbi:MAG: DUF4143 domain-containing protein, partial [Planctomycetes bacterium]|nr:DUF4143 domain-containing protein [Planctomycetota bacterium]
MLAPRLGRDDETGDVGQGFVDRDSLLAATFILRPVLPWFTNRIKRVVKSPKMYFGDTGLLAHVLGANPGHFGVYGKLTGTLLENFVATE